MVIADEGLVADDVVFVVEGGRFEDFTPVHGVHVVTDFELHKNSDVRMGWL